MKVLYIASGDYKYGASKSMMSLLFYLREHYDVTPVLLTKQHNELNEICDRNGIENHSFWYCDFMSGSPYSFLPLKLAKHIVKFGLYLWGSLTQSGVLKCGIDFSQIDLIHTNLNRLAIGAYISKKCGIPHVWHLREFGREDYNVRFYRPGTIAYMNRYADRFIAISESVKQCWLARGIDPAKTDTVYNGLETEGYLPKAARGDDKMRLVISGHVQPSKGQLDLVKAIALLPEEIRGKVELDILGEGYQDYIHEIHKVIGQYGLDHVHLCGYCDHMTKKLAEYDVGVTCSRAEGFGRVTVEYMRAGLYVVASDTGANPELVQDAAHGLLYRYGDSKDLAEKLAQIYRQPERYRGLQNNTTDFTMDKCAEGVYRIYQEILKD